MKEPTGLALATPDHPLVKREQPLVIALLVIDRSSSMVSFGEAPLEGMRDLVTNLQNSEEAESIGIGIISFAEGTSIDVPIQMSKDVDASKLSYRPSGGTRLYGTVYDALYLLLQLATFRDRLHLETKVIMTVLTDGDNTMHPHMLSSCRILAAEARRRKWELAVFGIGTPGSKIANEIGFSGASSTQYDGKAGEPVQPAGYDMPATPKSINTAVEHTMRSTLFTVTGRVVTSAPPGAKPANPHWPDSAARDTPTPR